MAYTIEWTTLSGLCVSKKKYLDCCTNRSVKQQTMSNFPATSPIDLLPLAHAVPRYERASLCRSIRHRSFSLIVKAFSSSYNTRITVHFQSVFTADYRSRYRVEFYNGQFDIMPLLANITFNRTLESFSSYSNDLLVRLCHSCDDPRRRSCWNQSDQIQLYVVNDDGKHTWKAKEGETNEVEMM